MQIRTAVQGLTVLYKTSVMNFLPLFGVFALAESNCVDPSINEFAQDDPKLIKYISENLLSPPPPFPQHVSEMDLSIEEYDNVLGKKNKIDVDYSALQGQYGQAPFIEDLFKPLIKAENTTKRFYIEAGAFDGVKGSNTLRLELNPLWSGSADYHSKISFSTLLAVYSIQYSAFHTHTCTDYLSELAKLSLYTLLIENPKL